MAPQMNYSYFRSSIGRKQIVAVTGLLLIGYLIIHLAGNLALFLGPEFFNGYAEFLSGLRPGITLIEFALFLVFVTHIYFTTTLVLENIRARSSGYAVKRNQGERSWATRLMPYSGTFLLAFVIWHIYDFTLVDKMGPRSFMDGQSFGLYGIVYNSFVNPMHSTLYIIAMACLGLHLWHGVESFMQTFGWNDAKRVYTVRTISQWFAATMTLGFSSIPVYVMLHYYLN